MEKSEIETIYRKYFHDVFLYIRTLSENESLAEEITQETFLKAMNNIEKFDGRKDIRAWLFVIAKNTYFRYCRRNKIYVGEEFSEIMQDSMQDTSPAVLDHVAVYFFHLTFPPDLSVLLSSGVHGGRLALE